MWSPLKVSVLILQRSIESSSTVASTIIESRWCQKFLGLSILVPEIHPELCQDCCTTASPYWLDNREVQVEPRLWPCLQSPKRKVGISSCVSLLLLRSRLRSGLWCQWRQSYHRGKMEMRTWPHMPAKYLRTTTVGTAPPRRGCLPWCTLSSISATTCMEDPS